MTTTLPVRPPAPPSPSADRPTDQQASTPETDIALAPATSAQPTTKDGVTIVVFSGEFDRVQAAFNIAVGAASSGLPVTMFFTFWGLDVLTRPDASRMGRDPLRTAFRWLKPGGARRLPLTRFNFLGLGPVLMRRLMGQFHMPRVDEMVDLAHSLGVKLVACTITMGVMGLTEADLLPIVDAYAGVATYLADAKGSDVNLFI
ncbi:MAG: DsrE/DsrF/DrsH-like family protein [Candidatus Limnocylindrales bacterium]|jgi:peroxiredoxin family protein